MAYEIRRDELVAASRELRGVSGWYVLVHDGEHPDSSGTLKISVGSAPDNLLTFETHEETMDGEAPTIALDQVFEAVHALVRERDAFVAHDRRAAEPEPGGHPPP